MIKYWLFMWLSMTGNLTMERVQPHIKTVQDIQTLCSVLKYVDEDTCMADEYIEPDIFLSKGRGDCDDFARITYELSQTFTRDCWIVVCDSCSSDYKHVIVKVRYSNIDWIFNCGYLERCTLVDYCLKYGWTQARPETEQIGVEYVYNTH